MDVREYSLLPSARLLRIIHVLLPAGKEIDDIDFSPSGDRVAWVCSESYVSPVLAWLHRWAPRVPATPQQRLSLWVTRIDGSDPREIGHIPIATVDPNAWSDVSDIGWLPSAKRLSFVYKDSLYTVPAE